MSFFSTNAAISVLRAGKKHPRWKEAAEYVIERASPEVQLLLTVGRQLERDEILAEQQEQTLSSRDWGPLLKFALIILVTALVSGGIGYVFSDVIAWC